MIKRTEREREPFLSPLFSQFLSKRRFFPNSHCFLYLSPSFYHSHFSSNISSLLLLVSIYYIFYRPLNLHVISFSHSPSHYFYHSHSYFYHQLSLQLLLSLFLFLALMITFPLSHCFFFLFYYPSLLLSPTLGTFHASYFY